MKHAERDFSTHSVVTAVSSLHLEPSHLDNGPLCFHLSHGHQNTGEICDISFSISIRVSISLPGLRIALYNSSYSILATILMPPPHVCNLSHSSAQAAQCSVHFISPVSLSLFFQGSYGHDKPGSIRPGNITCVISRPGKVCVPLIILCTENPVFLFLILHKNLTVKIL